MGGHFFPPFCFFFFSFFFSIPDTLAEDVPRIGQKDLAIKCSFCRIKQAIWRVFRARHKDSIAAPYLHAIKIQKFPPLGGIENCRGGNYGEFRWGSSRRNY